jgi:hypothetical protein
MMVLNLWYHRQFDPNQDFYEKKVLPSITLPGGTKSLLSGVVSATIINLKQRGTKN